MKESINLLFIGVGRRVELVQAFKEAAYCLNKKVVIYGAELTETAPALVYCDFFRRIGGVKDSDYLSQLLSICKEDIINLVIPTVDLDLLLLSQNKALFEELGTRVLISDLDKVSLCRDKNYTADFFESCGLKAPHTYNDYKLYNESFPCFIKPKDGSSSVNAFKVNNYTELETYANKIVDYIVQPFIDGIEYTVDIFCDFNGNPVFITPRIRLAVRSGEVLKTRIALDETIISECKKLIDKFKPRGPLTVQLIRQKETNEDYYIEINPRYGGGAPLSMKAGARSAEVILKLLSNEGIEENYSIDDEAVYSRFDQSVCTMEGNGKQPIRGVIFDLDDTLYSEKQYIKSGFKAVAEYLGNISYAEKLWDYYSKNLSPINYLLDELSLRCKEKECVEVYREHTPDISLYDNVLELINALKNRNIKVGIITDGRVSGQKKKIEALHLDNYMEDIIITDELGGPQFRKPCDVAFRILQRRWNIPFEQLVYLGDNLAKDFKAPKQLGMKTVYFENTDGIYYKEIDTDAKTITKITDFTI